MFQRLIFIKLFFLSTELISSLHFVYMLQKCWDRSCITFMKIFLLYKYTCFHVVLTSAYILLLNILNVNEVASLWCRKFISWYKFLYIKLIPWYYGPPLNRQNLEQPIQFISSVHYGQSCSNTGCKLLPHELTSSWQAINLFASV